MAYDLFLGDRVEQILRSKAIIFEAKKMMGGLCFMVAEKMCVGIVKDTLMCRVGPDKFEECLSKEGCNPMDFTGRPMKGYVFITPEVIDTDDSLEYWVQLCLDFNPLAKSSKAKKDKRL